jgi:hypothetical protein
VSTPLEPEPVSESDPAPPPFPWPPAESDSVVDALVDTWRGAVLHPARFFAALPPRLRLGPVLLYYLVIGVVGAALQLFWAILLPRPESTLLGEIIGTNVAATPLVEFLASPLYLLFSLYLAAGITHLLVLALVPQHRGFGTTLRVFAFAYSPVLLGVVPYLGPIAAFIWMTAISIVGIRVAHATTTGRAAGAVLVPIAAALFLLAVGYLLLASSGALLLP